MSKNQLAIRSLLACGIALSSACGAGFSSEDANSLNSEEASVPVPRITGIAPAVCKAAGGCLVTISGTGLAGATVLIGGVNVPVRSSTSTQLNFTAPDFRWHPQLLNRFMDVVVRNGNYSAILPGAFQFYTDSLTYHKIGDVSDGAWIGDAAGVVITDVGQGNQVFVSYPDLGHRQLQAWTPNASTGRLVLTDKVSIPDGPQLVAALNTDTTGETTFLVTANGVCNATGTKCTASLSVVKHDNFGVLDQTVQTLLIGTGAYLLPVAIAAGSGNMKGAKVAITMEDGSVFLAEIDVATGKPTKAAKQPVVAAPPAGLALADVDNNGFPDLVMTLPSLNKVAVHTADNMGIISPTVTYSPSSGGNQPAAVQVLKLSLDPANNYPDLVVTNQGQNSTTAGQFDISLLRNDKTGNFAVDQTMSLSGCQGADALSTGDLNADGNLDLIVRCSGIKLAQTYLAQTPPGTRPYGFGQAKATLSLPSHLALGPLAVGDLNGDGLADVLLITEKPTATSILTLYRTSL